MDVFNLAVKGNLEEQEELFVQRPWVVCLSVKKEKYELLT